MVTRGLSNLSWLFSLLATVLVASFVFYFYQLYVSNLENQRSAKIFEQSLAASIDQFEYLPAVLAQDDLIVELLQEPDLGHHTVSNKFAFVVSRSGANDIFLQDRSGNVVASSNYQSESGSFLNKNYSFRPYFKKAKQERKRQFYFAKGATTGVPGFFISAPVIVNNEVIGVVVVKLELLKWEENWRKSEDTILVSDKNGVVILSSNPDWRYHLVDTPSQKSLNLIYTQKQFPGEVHNQLFESDSKLRFTSSNKTRYWKFSKSAYIVNEYLIGETQWTLHHLVNYKDLLSQAFLFFIFASLLGSFVYLFMTERHKKQKFRRKAIITEKSRREDLQKLIDNIHIGVFVIDGGGQVLSMNAHAEHLMFSGKSFKDIESRMNIEDLVHVDISKDEIDQYLLENIETPAYHETYANVMSANMQDERTIPVMFAISQVDLADSYVYLMTLVNIAKRKTVEEELVRVNESLEETVEARTEELKSTQLQLIQKNKAEALGNMAATIVHELSQPLAAINSSVAAIQSKTKSSNWQGVGESVSRLLPLSSKMNKVIKLLKHFSYDDSAMIELVSLSSIYEQVLDSHRDLINDNNIKVSIDDKYDAAKVRISPLKIDLALSNIIRNAIDVVQAKDKPEISIFTAVKDGVITINIADNGGGVDEDIMARLFNPYFTTKEVGKGMGLGLSITYEILQQNDGDIAVENVNDGACFSISLPLVSEERKQA